MTLLQPSGLWFLLALPAIFILYLIQSRYRPQVVASLLLWKRMARDLEAEAAWRRPRWDLILALQLLTAGAIALALARPAILGMTERHMALVLDTSASMAARDVAPTRLAAAKQAIADAANAAPDGVRLSLVSAGSAPRVLVQDGTPVDITQALDDVQAEPTSGDLPNALQVAAGLADNGSITVVTDGAFNIALQSLTVPVTFKPVGGGAQTLAVSDVSLRRPVEGGDYLAGFARIVNETGEQQTTTLAVLADNVLVDRAPLQVDPGSHADTTFHVPAAAQTVTVGLTERGALPAADRVDLLGYAHWTRSIVIVSDQPSMWEHVLSVVPNVTTRAIRPADFAAASAAPNEIYLFDNVIPSTYPSTPMILVNPPDGSGVLARVDTLQRQRRATSFDVDDPLLQSVDIAPLNVQQLERAVAPAWAAATVSAEDTPLILHGRFAQQPTVLFAFDPNHSNLPHLTAFPQLMANAVDWLTPGRQTIVEGGIGSRADIQPRPLADLPAIAPGLQTDSTSAPREVWPWVLAAALTLFAAEWFVAVRRG